MGQFLGFESYDIKRMCDTCGEIGLEADMIDHENYCQGTGDEDEFVKHKILDAIGDLYLLGHPMIGEFSAHKSGHSLNNKLLRTLLADDTAWELVTFDNPEEAPISFMKLASAQAT